MLFVIVWNPRSPWRCTVSHWLSGKISREGKSSENPAFASPSLTSAGESNSWKITFVEAAARVLLSSHATFSTFCAPPPILGSDTLLYVYEQILIPIVLCYLGPSAAVTWQWRYGSSAKLARCPAGTHSGGLWYYGCGGYYILSCFALLSLTRHSCPEPWQARPIRRLHLESGTTN